MREHGWTVTKSAHAQAAKDLRAAAAVLVERGWVQGWLAKDERGRRVAVGEPGARYCAVGAVACVLLQTKFSDQYDWSRDPRLDRAKEAFVAVHHEHIACWNDKPGRTAEEVIAALLAAADAEERAQ